MSQTVKLIGKQMKQCFTNNWRKRHKMPMLKKPTKEKILKGVEDILVIGASGSGKARFYAHPIVSIEINETEEKSQEVKTAMKAICEMSEEELKAEYQYCIAAAESSALEADNRRYFMDRATAIKIHIEEIEKEAIC